MHLSSLLVECYKGKTFLNKISACFATTNFGYTVHDASINFGYIGRNFGYFGDFFRVYWYTTTPPPPPWPTLFYKRSEMSSSLVSSRLKGLCHAILVSL